MHSRKRCHPIYKRVRVVELLEDNTMVCSCNRPRRHLMTCGHIMLIVGISHPIVHHVRWWNGFQLHCARDNKLTEHFNKMLMNTNDAVSVKGLIIDLQHGLCLCCFDLFHNCYCDFNYHCNYKFSRNYNFNCNYKFSCNCDFCCNYNFLGAHCFGLFSLHLLATSSRWRLFSTLSSTSRQQGP